MDSTYTAPGSYVPLFDKWGPFSNLVSRLPPQSLVLLDRRVDKLHPSIRGALASRAQRILKLEAGEEAKSSPTLDRVVAAGLGIPRSGTLVCIGGGTLGDLATVAAHVLKRGLNLIHVPSTLLAAVDSSVGGKGALHSGGPHPVKNALGVFHYPKECWICPELFSTLSPRQLREGATEAWKEFATLSESLWKRHRKKSPSLESLIRSARSLKAQVCAEDPYEHQGRRAVLNFGHTFGHVIESWTAFRVSHGDAVGLGMLCALDVGRALGVTASELAVEIEAGLRESAGILGRPELAHALSGVRPRDLVPLLRADKKNNAQGDLRMVLVPKLGKALVQSVPEKVWARLLPYWQAAERPS